MKVDVDREEVRRLLDGLPDGILAVDERGRVRFASLAAAASLGYERSELIDAEIDRLFDSPASLRQLEAAAAAVPAGSGLPALPARELRMRRSDGALVPMSVRAVVMEGAAGPLTLLAIREAAVSERMHTAPQPSEANYRLLVENASEIFYEVSIADDPLRGEVRFVSNACEAVTGHAPVEFVDRPALWIECIHPDDRAALFESTRTILASRQPGSRTYRVRNARTGQHAWIEDRIIPRFDATGAVTGYQGVARDVTARMRAEAEQLRLEAALRQAQKMEAIGRLSGGVAHDFNNILTVVLGHAEAALASIEPTHPVVADLKEIVNAGNRAAELTRQLLSFARMQPAAPAVVDVNARLRDMERLLQRTVGQRCTLALELAPGLWRTRIDPSQIDQIVINLAVNAADAMPGGGPVTVSTANITLDQERGVAAGCRAGDYVALAVRDVGRGMDESTLARAFEPFFTTKPAGKGTGLGLATVYGVAQQNKGGVATLSEPGRGTTVTVYLPRVAESPSPRPPESLSKLSP
jgi:PAS domain S-box-containing protein